MVKQISNPAPNEWKALCRRPALALDHLESSVRNILTRVKTGGDEALRALTSEFDRVALTGLELPAEALSRAADEISPELKNAIQTAAKNIRSFHAAQRREPMHVETMPGVLCWRQGVAIDKVGIYIPGGSAPLFSTVLMLAIPAQLAGCREIILCSPPAFEGRVHPAILYTAGITGVTRVFQVGGAQAIAALAYGTESIPAVYKIFGPGNQYVTQAKQLVSQEGVAIDMPAGPSEVLVLADTTANPAFVAADLLSQAEHGADSQVVLVTTHRSLPDAVAAELAQQLEKLPRREMAGQALAHSLMVCFDNEAHAFDFTNAYAPEHLIVHWRDEEAAVNRIRNAGSVFVGPWSPESVGDYASGTNHTLPTNGYAAAYGGVSLESFQRFITYQRLTPEGLKAIAPAVEEMATAEALEAHRQAVRIRLNAIG
jgi:histidinol dehydrogenase